MTDDIRHTVSYRARFDECSPRGVARTSAFLRFAQDCAWIHSESIGLDRAWYAERGLAWLVRCVELEVLDDVPLGGTLSVTTQVVAWRRVWVRRRTDLRARDGTTTAIVHTDWVLVDDRGTPTRIPGEVESRFGGLGSFTPNRVTLDATPGDALRTAFEVRDHDLDPMAHVNNARYLDYVDEAVAAVDSRLPVELPRTYRLEYLQPAPLGAHLVGRAWRSDSVVAYRLEDAASGVELLRATLAPAVSSARTG